MPYELSRRLGAGPLLCDGAMGTLLYARGVSVDACFDVLNLNNPRVIQSIHADYIAAGVDCIETNTFVPVLVGILRSTARVTPSSSTTRSQPSRSPSRSAGVCAKPATARSAPGSRWRRSWSGLCASATPAPT